MTIALTVYETHCTLVTELAGDGQGRRSQTKQEGTRNSGHDL
jgi:hypothetical protein